MAIRIVVDPGHYGDINPGVIPGYYESRAMLQLGRALAWELQKRGAQVQLTRTTAYENPSLEERGRLAAGKNLFISLHSDAAGGTPPNPNIRGATVYYSVQRPNSLAFANNIGYAVSGAMNTPFLGSRARALPEAPGYDYYGVLRAAVAAGVQTAFLVEHGYHTNYTDNAALLNGQTLQRIADAEANAIAAQYGLGWLYTVRAGDTLYSIGRRVWINWQRLAFINNINNGAIRPGQVLFIPSS